MIEKNSKNYFFLVLFVIFLIFIFFNFKVSNFKFSNSEENSIQELLENPQLYSGRSLEVKGTISSSQNLLYVKDSEGYKIEIRECSRNRDLILDKKHTLKGYIFAIENPSVPVFYCGVYDDLEYHQRFEYLENKLKQIETETQLIEAQNKAQEEQKIAEQEAAIEKLEEEAEIAEAKAKEDAIIASEIKEIEDKYKVDLASIPSGTQKSAIETYTWLPPFSRLAKSMEGWSLGGCTGCSAAIYEEVVDNKYKVTIIIQYRDDGRTYRGNTLSVSVI